MGSDIIIWPTLLSIHRSWEVPWTVKILGLHEFKDRIVYGAHLIGSDTILPTSSLALLHTGNPKGLTEKSVSELLDSTELTSPSSDFRRNLGTIAIEIGTHESSDENATILTVDFGTNVIVLVIRVLTILLVDLCFLERESDHRMQRKIGSTTENRIRSSGLISLTDSLSITLTREHRTYKLFFVCHNLKILKISVNKCKKLNFYMCFYVYLIQLTSKIFWILWNELRREEREECPPPSPSLSYTIRWEHLVLM